MPKKTNEDLSKVAVSVTSHFIEVMPEIDKILANPTLNKAQKRDEVATIAIQALNISDASTKYYNKTRDALLYCRTAEAIKDKMLTIIENGKNYGKDKEA